MEVLTGTVDVEDPEEVLADLETLVGDRDVTLQAFDGRYVAGRDHLERVVTCAARARENGEAIADDHAMELLCYGAATRQIDRALAIGVTVDATVVVVVTGPEEEAVATDLEGGLSGLGRTDEPATGDPERIREHFDIGSAELAVTDEPLEGLVVERVSLLAVEK